MAMTFFFCKTALKVKVIVCEPMDYTGGSSQPRDLTQVSLIAIGFFTVSVTRETPPTQNKKFGKKKKRETFRETDLFRHLPG